MAASVLPTLFEPAALWNRVRQLVGRRGAVFGLLAMALLGGLVVAIATEIGVRHFNSDWNWVAGYSVQRDRGWETFVLLWAAAAGLSIAQGLAGALLLPLYGRPRDWIGGLAVGVFGALPIYAAGIALVLLPGILLVCIAFLVSCAWWGSGARLLLGVPYGEAADHVAASLVTSGLALSFAAAVFASL